ncbi:MAG: glycosyltransferase [Alphaproteobacteria bacterium]|nr:glycosyltransferase [Alphaproteobacteria bacterium]MCW5738687.1 glycosyltransferase [Alphaproteobacteria bacterium]
MRSDRHNGRAPRCLWLTLSDPEPRHNGQYVYSGGLIDAVIEAGAEVEVLGLARPESRRSNGWREPHVVWWLADNPPLPRWASLLSRLPHMAHRCSNASARATLDSLLARDGWDGIVFDSISCAWALPRVLQRYADRADRPTLLYISHNHEESLRSRIADGQGHFLKRQASRLDAYKVSRLERHLVDAVDVVTAITPEDLALYRRRSEDKPMEVLTPGYHGRRVASRRVTDRLPRRAVIVGSFDWVAKRMNLEEFVRVADPLFATAGIELQAVGSAEESFLEGLRRTAKASTFTGTVDDVTGYLNDARVAIVPERNGGGFKLKLLEYVFNRIPIFGLAGAFAGIPLRHGESAMVFPDHGALARGVLEMIDDFDLLNRLQERAYEACRDRFDWSTRGRQILAAIG